MRVQRVVDEIHVSAIQHCRRGVSGVAAWAGKGKTVVVQTEVGMGDMGWS